MIVMVTVTMIAVLGDDLYPRAITGIDAAGWFGLQGHMRNAETGLQHLPRGFHQFRPVIEVVQLYVGGKGYLSR